MAIAFHLHDVAPFAHPTLSLGELWRRLEAVLNLWRDRAVTRQQLAEMDDRLLKDIGLTRLDAEREYSKPFWRS